jgi:hypothetical protein
MIEDTLKQLDPSWSELLKEIISVETSHPSPRKLEKLTKKELAILQDLVSVPSKTNIMHAGKMISVLVGQSPTQEVAKLLGTIITDLNRSQSERTIAAIEIRRLPAEVAEPVLVRRLAVDEPQIQNRVIQSLGRIGGPAALKKLEKLPEPKESFVRRQWEFSKRLIQYRHGLQSKTPLQSSGTNWLIDSGEPPMPLPVGPLNSKRLKASLDTLKDKTLGVELSDRPGFSLDLGADNYLILGKRLEKEWDQKYFSETPAIAGVIAIWNKRTKSAELNQVMLSTPCNRGILFHSYRLDGSLRFEGSGSIREKVLFFTLTSLERSGQCLYRIIGKLDSKGMKIIRAESLKTFPAGQTQPLSDR